MNHALTLLAEIFIVGLLHMLINHIVDTEKMPQFPKITTAACYVISIFLIARFAVAHLFPQIGGIFRMVL